MASNAKLSGRRGLQSRLTGRDLSSGINPARTSKSRNGSEGLLSEEGRAQRSKSSISLRNGVNSRGGKENDPVPLDPRAKALKVAIDVNPEELANWIEMLNYLRKSQLASSGLLIEWYDKAVDELPVEKYRKNHDYFRICMIWASLHKQDGIGEMKSRLRWMMGNRIGLDHAELFVSKAKLEIEEGDYIKAKDTLQKGILRCAQPQSLLDNELKSVEGYITHESSGSKCDRSVNITDEMTSSSRRSTSKGSLHVSGIGRSSHENHDVAPRTSISQSLKQLLVEDDESSDRQASNVQVSVPEMDSEKPAVFPVTNDSSSGNRYVTSRNLNPVDSSKMTPSQAINPVPEQSSHQSKSKPITALEKNVSFSVDDSQKKSKSATELNLIEPANLKNLPLGSKQPSFLLNGHIYQKLELVGKGGSGKVFKVVGENYKIYALKRIKFQPTDVKTIENLKNEMELLKRLKGKPHIIQMYDCQEDYKKGIILMLFEFGEIDLARVLKRNEGRPLKVNQIKNIWEQMLEAVQTIHEERIVHGDLKPANFMFVAGELKLIDFGIAKAIHNDTTHIERDTQIGTINYMSPEAIRSHDDSSSKQNDAITKYKLGRPSDIWSLGCILYQMVYGHTPFHHIQRLMMKLFAITDAHYPIPFPPSDYLDAADVLRKCLQRDPMRRPTIPDLLNHDFLRPELRNITSISQETIDGIMKVLQEELLKAEIDTSRLDRDSVKSRIMHLLRKPPTD